MIRPFAALREIVNIPAYHKRLMEKPTVALWEKIAYGDHKRQYALFAAQEDPLAPVAVWFHGGGWQFGSPEKLIEFGEYFYRRGYAVWMPSHRRLPRFDGTAIYSDACSALSLVQKHASTPPQLLLGGMSSGGQLAALSALRQNDWRNSGTVQGLITCGSPLSLRHMGVSPTRWRFAGSSKKEEFNSFDPLAQLTEKPSFPAVIVHGSEDGLVPWKSALAFVNEAKKLEWDALTFVNLPGGSHLDSASFLKD
ncbi:MAG: alpha/beta hydrolase [Saprospiraceae bacterium]